MPVDMGRAMTAMLTLAITCAPTACYAEDAPARPRRRALVRGSQSFYADTFKTRADAPRYLYPGQDELEGLLTGDAEFRRRYATLLPLLQASRGFGILRPNDDYQIGILQTIAKEKWKEGIPLLAWGMQETAPGAPMLMRSFFLWRRRDQAAAVWLWLATQDTDDDGDMELILRILKDEEPSVQPGMIEPLADAIDRETLRLVVGGARKAVFRDSLLTLLAGADSDLATEADVDRAVLIGRLLGKYGFALEYPRAIEEHIFRISENPSPFSQVVVWRAIHHLANPGDAGGLDYGHGIRSDELDDLSLEACEGLWRCEFKDPEFARRIRSDIVLGGPVGIDLMFEFMKELYESPERYAGRDLIPEIALRLETENRENALPAEVIAYLEHMVADPRFGSQAMVMRPEEDFGYHIEEVKNIYRTYTSAKAAIDRILESRDGK